MADKKPVLTPDGLHVYLFNSATGGLWECPTESAETQVEYLGWEYVDAPAQDDSHLFPDAEPKSKPAAKKASSKTSGD